MESKEIEKLNATEYKKYHEAYMQNNHGSSAHHVFFCILFTIQCSIFASFRPRQNIYTHFVYEYFVIVLPLILASTILSDYIYMLNITIAVIILYKTITCGPKLQRFNKKFMSQNVFKTDRNKSISCIRGVNYLMTVLCILAVDFKSFPRMLAKTERYGYSLMDTGVGLFVLMGGIVHRDVDLNNYFEVLKANTKFIFILSFLGIARCVSVKQLDYHEHISEYGVHWNFFFTLAVCKIFSTAILCFPIDSLLFSFLILTIHELSLHFGLEEWVFGNAPRDSFLTANREGVTSSLGYISLYLFGVYVKKLICDKTVIRKDLQFKLLLGSVLLWILTYSVDYLRPASRTLANAGYCVFLDACLMTVMSILYFYEIMFSEKRYDKLVFEVPCTLSLANSNGLSYFLGANLLTGAINMSMKTLPISSLVSFVILNAYMIVSFAFIVYLKEKGVMI